MIALGKIKEAEQLLAEGKLSHRKIAAAIGISRSTVGAIASGRRPDYEARQRARETAARPQGPRARCGECGGMVFQPCRLCLVRKIKAAQQEAMRAARRRARQQALLKLIVAVRNASRLAEALDGPEDHLAAAEAGGASDCK